MCDSVNVFNTSPERGDYFCPTVSAGLVDFCLCSHVGKICTGSTSSSSPTLALRGWFTAPQRAPRYFPPAHYSRAGVHHLTLYVIHRRKSAGRQWGKVCFRWWREILMSDEGFCWAFCFLQVRNVSHMSFTISKTNFIETIKEFHQSPPLHPPKIILYLGKTFPYCAEYSSFS